MRKILTISLLTLLFNLAASAQKQETIEGNGKLVTREVPVSSFSELKASGIYELKLSQGEKESVKIEADENLQPYFNVTSNGSKLVIDMDKLKNKNLNVKGKMKVYVTFKSLKNMDLRMVGNTVSDEPLSFNDLDVKNKSVGNLNLQLTADKISLDNKSVGTVTLSGKADRAILTNNGVGALHAGEFVVQNMSIENDGVGAAEVNAVKELRVKENRLSKVKNKGNAPVKRSGKVTI